MYLSKFELNINNPSARQALMNVQDLHRNVQALFGQGRKEAGVLFRLDDTRSVPVIYVMSKQKPEWTESISFHFVGIREIDDYIDSMKMDKLYHLDICTIPCKRVDVEGKKNSRRILLNSMEERMEWMNRKSNENGYEIIAMDEMRSVQCYGKKNGHKLALKGYQYQGMVKITDEARFRDFYMNGLGPDKAYGFGMPLLIERKVV